MVILIKVFYFSLEDELPNTELIPGEVFITGNFKNNSVLKHSVMQNIHIVDMKKRLVRVTNMCHICKNFHITNGKYRKILGRHSEKYKILHFFNYNLPITRNCPYFKIINSKSRIGDRGLGIGDFQINEV
jgi:hypothetical protein